MEMTYKEVLDAYKRLLEENLFLKKRIAELERKLMAYENAHTPPSKRMFVTRNSKPKKPVGRSKGFKGTTRRMPKPNTWIRVRKKRCPHCKNKLPKPSHVEKEIIEEIPKPQPVRVIQYSISHYDCKRCGRHVVANHPDCPKGGRFGNNTLTHVALMKYEDRLPYRKIQHALKRQFDLDVTPSSIFDFTRRVSDAVRNEYDSILRRVRQSEVVYVDETSIKVNRKKYWIWVFVTGTETLVVVRSSRGKDVLDEVLGGYQGVIVCDGWKVYRTFTTNLQRCWAHLLREADYLSEKLEGAKPLSEGLHTLYNNLNSKLSTDPPPKQRRLMRRRAEDELLRMICRSYESKKIRELTEKINNGFDYWFTFVENPRVESTNNRAERALREHVVQRKIIGTLRNEKGTFIHETMMTVLATWKQMGLNSYDMLMEHLRS